uniref:Uncharacterized protein n=1 Tax=Cannabis sativa TaxID=3483 RepID=A0A803PJE6_CANSA
MGRNGNQTPEVTVEVGSVATRGISAQRTAQNSALNVVAQENINQTQTPNIAVSQFESTLKQPFVLKFVGSEFGGFSLRYLWKLVEEEIKAHVALSGILENIPSDMHIGHPVERPVEQAVRLVEQAERPAELEERAQPT